MVHVLQVLLSMPSRWLAFDIVNNCYHRGFFSCTAIYILTSILTSQPIEPFERVICIYRQLSNFPAISWQVQVNYVPQTKFGRHIVFAPFLLIIINVKDNLHQLIMSNSLLGSRRWWPFVRVWSLVALCVAMLPETLYVTWKKSVRYLLLCIKRTPSPPTIYHFKA